MKFWLLVADECADRAFGVVETREHVERVTAWVDRVRQHTAGITAYLADQKDVASP